MACKNGGPSDDYAAAYLTSMEEESDKIAGVTEQPPSYSKLGWDTNDVTSSLNIIKRQQVYIYELEEKNRLTERRSFQLHELFYTQLDEIEGLKEHSNTMAELTSTVSELTSTVADLVRNNTSLAKEVHELADSNAKLASQVHASTAAKSHQAQTDQSLRTKENTDTSATKNAWNNFPKPFGTALLGFGWSTCQWRCTNINCRAYHKDDYIMKRGVKINTLKNADGNQALLIKEGIGLMLDYSRQYCRRFF